MQDFLKDRPVLALEDAKMIVSSAMPSLSGNGASGPFARIVRDPAAIPPPRPAAPASTRPSTPGSPASVASAPAHTSQVKTVMENGRVARLIVTCSCGKVTEIACAY